MSLLNIVTVAHPKVFTDTSSIFKKLSELFLNIFSFLAIPQSYAGSRYLPAVQKFL